MTNFATTARELGSAAYRAGLPADPNLNPAAHDLISGMHPHAAKVAWDAYKAGHRDARQADDTRYGDGEVPVAPARTRTGTLTPTTRDPVRVTVALAPEDNLPTRASLDVFVRALLLPDNDWYLDVPWDADRDDGSTRLVLRRDYNDSAFAILVLDPEEV
jgi:hypothetical protein